MTNNSHPRGGGFRPQRARRWFLHLPLLMLVPLQAAADLLKETQARAVRAVVKAQLEAFAAGNAAKAFALATPAIRQQFVDAASFLNMVLTAYPMVVRPQWVTYFQAVTEGGVVTQTLRLRDIDGQLWLASYDMQRQANGKWLINGCVVELDDDKSWA